MSVVGLEVQVLLPDLHAALQRLLVSAVVFSLSLCYLVLELIVDSKVFECLI